MARLFGVVGYVFFKLGCEPAPLLLGFILGPMMEENLRRALLLSRGDWTTFATRPLSAGLLLAALAMIVVVCCRRSRPSAKRPSRKRRVTAPGSLCSHPPRGARAAWERPGAGPR